MCNVSQLNHTDQSKFKRGIFELVDIFVISLFEINLILTVSISFLFDFGRFHLTFTNQCPIVDAFHVDSAGCDGLILFSGSVYNAHE